MQKNTLFTNLYDNLPKTALRLPMGILLMSYRHPLLHEIFTAFGVHADAHRVAGWRGGVVENLPHLVKQFDA